MLVLDKKEKGRSELFGALHNVIKRRGAKGGVGKLHKKKKVK